MGKVAGFAPTGDIPIAVRSEAIVVESGKGSVTRSSKDTAANSFIDSRESKDAGLLGASYAWPPITVCVVTFCVLGSTQATTIDPMYTLRIPVA